MIFQIVDWNYFHEDDDEGMKQYKIRLFVIGLSSVVTAGTICRT